MNRERVRRPHRAPRLPTIDLVCVEGYWMHEFHYIERPGWTDDWWKLLPDWRVREEQLLEIIRSILKPLVPAGHLSASSPWPEWAHRCARVDPRWTLKVLPCLESVDWEDPGALNRLYEQHRSRAGLQYDVAGMLLGLPSREAARHIFRRLSTPQGGCYLPWVVEGNLFKPAPVDKPVWSDFPLCARAQYYWAKLRRHLKVAGVGGSPPAYLAGEAKAQWKPWGYGWHMLECLAMVRQENVLKLATDPAFKVAEGADRFEEAEREVCRRVRKRARE